MRRLAAALVTIAALAIGGVICMYPVTISIFGTTGTCGPAIFAALSDRTTYGTDETSIALQPECRSQGWSMSLIGGIVGGAGLAAGAALLWLNTSKWPKAAANLRTTVMQLHYYAPDGYCPTCRIVWPCQTAQAIRVTLVSDPSTGPSH
ncbi:hypothetical protein OG894_45145 (plasmid) [Streptomyces sp. NBC_01724]|uniref:hypothetical protein n=1 Tax=Streptomyces sp. NBC_01724 TaxID=2975922 RepID=UPI002E2F6272|nr:hypothetical protein [Streptomyces sp. NBC_01724]